MKYNKKSLCNLKPYKSKDITGVRSGHLTALYPTDKRISGGVAWVCLCDCGNTVLVKASDITTGNRSVCKKNCIFKHTNKNVKNVSEFTHPREDLRGQRFGSLIVIEQAKDIIGSNGVHHTAWECKCDCGNNCIVKGRYLKIGYTKSCGCNRHNHGFNGVMNTIPPITPQQAMREAYIKYHGIIPDGYVVTALDGNIKNIQRDNLKAVSSRYIIKRVKRIMPDIVGTDMYSTAIDIIELEYLTNKMKRDKKV